jgi:hypothetical protein
MVGSARTEFTHCAVTRDGLPIHRLKLTAALPKVPRPRSASRALGGKAGVRKRCISLETYRERRAYGPLDE